MAKTLSRLDILLSENDGKFAIEEYIRLKDTGEPIPDELQQFIDSALRRHLAGDKLDRAFGLTRGRGNRPATASEKDEQLGMAVEVLRIVSTGEFPSENKAAEHVAGDHKPDTRTITGYLHEQRGIAEYLLRLLQKKEAEIATTD